MLALRSSPGGSKTRAPSPCHFGWRLRSQTASPVWAIDAGADPLSVLREISVAGIEPAGVALLARVAFDLDRGRPFPRALAEPASTWLSDLNLEAELRAAASRATTAFAKEFRTQGRAEEEGSIASLLTRLEAQLERAQGARGIDNPDPTPVELTGQYRRIPKSEEASDHADLVLTVVIDVAGELQTNYAEFIQAKKSSRLLGPGDTDSWRIDVEQLNGILTVSPTAVYWLLGAEGDVHVIPAKLIWAIGNAKGKLEQGSFTLHYTAIRHAAISLGGFLVDMTIGGWMGSQTPQALALASGNPATTTARNYFELTVRRSLG